jgi:hypothetical protein
MAEINGKVDLVVLGDVENVLLVLHVHSHELVANFWRVLSIVHRAEELSLDVLLQFDVAFKFDAFTLDLFAPAVLVEALSKEDHVGQNRTIVILVDPVTHPVEIECKDLIDQHVLAVSIGQAVVVSLPFFGVRSWRELLLNCGNTVSWVEHLLKVSIW